MENKIYTMQDWKNDKTFKAMVGQQVSEEVYQQFLGDMTPHYCKSDIMQVGEAYGTIVVNGHCLDTYVTFTGCRGHRTCQGHMPSLHNTNIVVALRNRNQL